MIISCKKCGKQMDIKPSRLATGRGKFCSRECACSAKTGKPNELLKNWDRNTMPEPNTGCLLWVGWANQDGYGVTQKNLKCLMVTRVLWENSHGPIPKGMVICHSCDTPACVNLNHLFLGTQKDNVLDAVSKGRMHSQKKTVCKNGHALPPLDLDAPVGTKRRCLACLRMWAKRDYYSGKRKDRAHCKRRVPK